MDMDGAFEDTSAKLPAEARDIILSRFYLDCTQRATISMCDRGEHDVNNRAVRYGTAGCRQGQCVEDAVVGGVGEWSRNANSSRNVLGQCDSAKGRGNE